MKKLDDFSPLQKGLFYAGFGIGLAVSMVLRRAMGYEGMIAGGIFGAIGGGLGAAIGYLAALLVPSSE